MYEKEIEETKRTEFFYKLSDKLDELFPKGDKRRGDAMVVAGISHIEGREEMRDIIINSFDKKVKEDK